MKKHKWVLPLLLIGVFLILQGSCKKADTTAKTPTVETLTVSNITQTSATCGGEIIEDGGAKILTCGVCWSANHEPTIDDNKLLDESGNNSFTSNIIGLTTNTPYFIRAFATNSSGTGYGETISFNTQGGTIGTVNDIDGNLYHTIIIGTQVWLVENLKTSKYRDGSSIPYITDKLVWSELTSPGYCWYNNSTGYKNLYGGLYNYYTIVDSRKLCPSGWHVPTDDEWTTLTTYQGGEFAAGGKLKETGTTHWMDPNSFATNESGFSALPGGCRDENSGDFITEGTDGIFWTSTEVNINNAWCRNIYFWRSQVYRYDSFGKGYGFSIRCIKDN